MSRTRLAAAGTQVAAVRPAGLVTHPVQGRRGPRQGLRATLNHWNHTIGLWVDLCAFRSTARPLLPFGRVTAVEPGLVAPLPVPAPATDLMVEAGRPPESGLKSPREATISSGVHLPSDGGGVQMVAQESWRTPSRVGHETATPPSACPRCLAKGCHHPACPTRGET